MWFSCQAKDLSDDLIALFEDEPRLMGHIHLPLQAGSDKILDLMNRKYKYEEYKKKIDELREIIPGAGISTDIVVGFPSEGVRDYDATRKALEEIKYNSSPSLQKMNRRVCSRNLSTMLTISIFSLSPGTPGISEHMPLMTPFIFTPAAAAWYSFLIMSLSTRLFSLRSM